MYEDDELDEILGVLPSSTVGSEPMKRGRGRPKGSKTKPKPEPEIMTTARLAEVMQGVSVPFLVQAFRMGRQTVLERLKGLAPIKHGNNGAPYYDLRQAAEYLVDPRVDIEAYIRQLSPEDLPERLRDNYWSARLKQQKWEENAGDLWRTDHVQQVLGELFRIVKTRTQLVVDSIDDKHGITDDQRDTFRLILDQMLKAMRDDLIQHARTHKTRPVLGEDDDV